MSPGTRHRLLVDEMLRMLADRIDGPIAPNSRYTTRAAHAWLRFIVPEASDIEIASAWREVRSLQDAAQAAEDFEASMFARWNAMIATRPDDVSAIDFTRQMAARGSPVAKHILSKLTKPERTKQ